MSYDYEVDYDVMTITVTMTMMLFLHETVCIDIVDDIDDKKTT